MALSNKRLKGKKWSAWGTNLVIAFFSFLLGLNSSLSNCRLQAKVGNCMCAEKNIFRPLADRDSKILDLFTSRVDKSKEYFFQNQSRYRLTAERSWGKKWPTKKWKNMDAGRLFTFTDWREWSVKYNLTKPKRFLSTSRVDVEESILEPESTDWYVFNGTHFDLHDMASVPNNSYDLVLLAQTLEHLYNPFLAMSELYKKVAPGGYLFTSTPALNMQHMTPFHFFHYTPMGLAVLMIQAGFEVVETGQFGSFHYEQIVLNEYRWPSYLELEKIGNGTIANDRRNPDQVWALLRKPI